MLFFFLWVGSFVAVFSSVHTHTHTHRVIDWCCRCVPVRAYWPADRPIGVDGTARAPPPFTVGQKSIDVCVCVPPLQPSNTRACVLSLSLSHTDTDTLDRQALAFGVSFPGRSFFIIGPTLFVVVGSKSGGFFLLFSDAELCNGDRVFIDQGCGGGAWGCVCVCRRRN